MNHFQLIHSGLDVTPILAELDAAPELWGQHRQRTGADGPMAGTDDIWLCYFPRKALQEPADYLREGRCEFYPAWRALPAIHPVTFALMAMVPAVELGGCLISRIPPGGKVDWHTDEAAWSARFYNRKFYVPLRSNEQAVNHCGDESVVMRPGTIWEFDNLTPHAVFNDGDTVRETLIVTMRGAG